MMIFVGTDTNVFDLCHDECCKRYFFDVTVIIEILLPYQDRFYQDRLSFRFTFVCSLLKKEYLRV